MPFLSLHIPTTNHPHPIISWNLLRVTYPLTKEQTPINQNLFLRRVLVFSLRTSLDCVSSNGGRRVEKKGSQPISPAPLPFVVKGPTKVSRYLWDGSCLQLVTVDGASASSSDVDFDNGFSRLCGSVVRDFFIPRHVKGDYMDYVKWKLLHRVFSSALQVLATQVFCRLLVFLSWGDLFRIIGEFKFLYDCFFFFFWFNAMRYIFFAFEN